MYMCTRLSKFSRLKVSVVYLSFPDKHHLAVALLLILILIPHDHTERNLTTHPELLILIPTTSQNTIFHHGKQVVEEKENVSN